MAFPSLGSWIERRAVRGPKTLALRTGGVDHSYGDLASRVRAIAHVLLRQGVRPGDRVAFHGVNGPTALASLFSTTALGAVWVPIHPARSEDEVRAVLDDSGARLVIRASPATHPDVGLPELDADELETRPPGSEPLPSFDPEPGDLAILAYTSGTTGPPKGVMLSHANLAWSVFQMLAACAFTSSDVTLAAAPFTRMGGLGVTVLPTLLVGGAIAIPSDVQGPGVLDAICDDRVTVLFANPDLLEAMVRAPGWPEADLSGVRTGVVGGGLVPETLLRAYLDRDVRLRHGYGLTEAAPVVSLLSDDEAAARADTVGLPLPFVDVRAVRPDGSTCDPNEVGEWLIRGPNVFQGYWGRTPVRDPDGWFPTGDVGWIDAEGYLHFLDRASSAMRVDDAVVYPATIERAAYGLPGVADAAAVAVEGRILLAMVPAPGGDPQAVLGSLRDALLPHEVPADVRLIAAIPRNAAGKVRRAELADTLAQEGD